MSSLSSSQSKVVKLKSSDNQVFEVDEGIMVISKTIKHFVEDLGTEHVIPLSNVNSKTLGMVMEWWETKKRAAGDGEERLRTLEAEFVDGKALVDVINAVNYLAIDELLDRLVIKMTDVFKKATTVEEIRERFRIHNDFSPEEEAALRKEYAWALDN